LLKYLRDDINAAMTRDPAAKSRLQVVLFYPGFHALLFHRVAHALHRRGWFWLPQLFAWFGRLVSGVEIHPGATIGKGMFIDHGMGSVVGATAIIGDNVTMYHGVTLGGRGFDRLGRRHPAIGDGALLGAACIILGPISIGDGAKIGAGAVVLESVPPGETAVGAPARLVPVKTPEVARSGGGRCISMEDV